MLLAESWRVRNLSLQPLHYNISHIYVSNIYTYIPSHITIHYYKYVTIRLLTIYSHTYALCCNTRYLNLLFGTPQWIVIYFSSGIFGFMLSCIYSPNSIGMGSSGSILGLLSAWILWIVFRWNKVPRAYHRQRNCQLGTIVIAVLVVVGLSFCPYVDWAENIGGVIQGIFMGAVVLSHEIERPWLKWSVRVAALSLSAMSFGLAWRAISETHPSLDLLGYYNANDQF